jgi:hypothetical protein
MCRWWAEVVYALGRTDGGNIRIDVRWAGGEVDRIQRLAFAV